MYHIDPLRLVTYLGLAGMSLHIINEVLVVFRRRTEVSQVMGSFDLSINLEEFFKRRFLTDKTKFTAEEKCW